jgi:hypothetical protein
MRGSRVIFEDALYLLFLPFLAEKILQLPFGAWVIENNKLNPDLLLH